MLLHKGLSFTHFCEMALGHDGIIDHFESLSSGISLVSFPSKM